MSLVSVIIPAYNVEKKIGRCLKSVMEQTCHDLQIIIVNDGSIDQTYHICTEYAKQDTRIELYTTENKGVSAARNFGLCRAKGKYVIFVDADDYLETDAVSVLLKERTGTEWVIGNYFVYPEGCEGKELHSMYFEEQIRRAGKDELPEICTNRNFYCVWGKLYSTCIIKEQNLTFPVERNYGEDLMFNISYFQFVHSFVILKKPVYNYCLNVGAGLGTSFRENEWKMQEEVCRMLIQMSKNEYRLKEQTQRRLHHFYYTQAVFTMDRIVKESSLTRREQMEKCSEVTKSKLFGKILSIEYEDKRICSLDYILLRTNHGWWYVKIHEWYVRWKRR